MLPGLSIERGPPLAAPPKFLYTAPWFAFLAGALLLYAGPGALASRWSPAVLAATHLLTLGFMMQAMLGALLQLLPVMAGVPVPGTALVAAIVHPALTAGSLLLAAGFVFGQPFLFQIAALLLAAAFVLYLSVICVAFARSWPPRQDSARNIFIALLGLLVTVVLGLLLLSTFGWGLSWPVTEMTNAHAAWGLVGWTVVLVLGVSLAVVPMFQMTSNYPAFVARWLGPGAFTALAGWSAGLVLGNAMLAALQWAAAAAVAVLAISTLLLQERSRRRQPDVTFLFWRLGMACLLSASVLWAAGQLLGIEASQPYALVLGVLMIPGFAVCVICGMLYKIVPFLLWIYLQMKIKARPPSVKQILPDARGIPQFWIHLVAVASLVAASARWHWLVYPGGALLALSGALLGITIIRASRFAARHVVPDNLLPPGEAKRTRWTQLR
ncbi:MAG: permease [Burkholderiales bacterium]